MKYLRKIKCLTLIIAIIIPMMMVFSSFITNAKADTDIPVDNYSDNGWHWGVDVGDLLYFEGETIISDAVTGNLINQYKELKIMNVSSIVNVTEIVSNKTLVYSQLNITMMYYNSTFDALVPLGDSVVAAEFALNSSHPDKYHYSAGDYNLLPLFLPLNSSGVIEWDNLTTILNETLYSYYAQMGFNNFDEKGFNSTDDSFWFRNSTDGYHIDLSYYNSHPTVNNGTLKEGKTSAIAPFGDPIEINVTITQVFDFNITDEIVWGVDVGDEFIYDIANKYDNDHNNQTYEADYNADGPRDKFASELKIVISKFNDTTYWIESNDFFNTSTPIVFQGVYADIYFWNISQNAFVLEQSDFRIGAANNFYPFVFSDNESREGPPLLILPVNSMQSDFEFFLHDVRLQQMGFDSLNFNWGTNIVEFSMWNSTGPNLVRVKTNRTTGMVMSYLQKSMEFREEYDNYTNTWKNETSIHFMYLELKNMTYIGWAIDVGEVFYFKQFGGEHEVEIRVTVLGFGYFFDNISFYLEEFLGLPLPTGQPELQFFSVVMGLVEHWDRELEEWAPEFVPDGLGGPGPAGLPPPPMIRPIAAANKYWAIAPPMLGGNPPMLLPNGTTGLDPEFQNLFDLMGFMFDDIQYGLNWASFSNTTAGTYMYYNFSLSTGMTTLLHGWSYRFDYYFGHFDWYFFSFYNETSVPLFPTLNTITLQSLWVLDVLITAEISVSAPGAQFIYALNAINPVNEPIPMGDDLFYLDIKITNHSLLTANISFDITIPSSIDLSTEYLYFFGWYKDSDTTNPEWGGVPQEFYDSIVYDYGTNSLTLEIPMEGPIMMLIAVGYGTEPPVTEPINFTLTSDAGNPDSDGSFMLSWTESTGAESYLVYVSNVCITDISGLLIPIASDITDLNYSITGLPNGTYYFVVVAHNFAGDTLSNCLEVIVGSGENEEIPGYNLLIILVAFVSVTAIIIKKRRKQ